MMASAQVLATLLLAGASPSVSQATTVPPASVLYSEDGLDHVLLWRRDPDAATSILSVQMGFSVRPGGGFPDGISNRLVSFKDKSYLELLYFERPKAELSGDALKAYQFAETSGGGVNNFALGVDNIDTLTAHLTSRGFKLNDPDPASYDPDGDGPQPVMPNRWRTVSFKEPALASSDVFFIRYDRPPTTPERAGDMAALATHPNSATGISAVWLLTADVKEDSKRLERMGFKAAGSVDMPSIKAKGVRFEAAREAIILLEANGTGPAAQAIAKRGAHFSGVSIGVQDLGRAQRLVERGTSRTFARYHGLNGEAFLAPMQDQLGLIFEFHQNP